MADLQVQFRDHIDQVQGRIEKALAECGFDSLVIGSGAPVYEFEDDRTAPYNANHHFRWWCPINVPDSLIHVVAGKKPKLFFYAPVDYWHGSPELGADFWQDSFDVEVLSSVDDIWSRVRGQQNAAYHGPDQERASQIGLNAAIGNSLLPRMNWARSFKTAYEVEMTKIANEKAAHGHRAAEKAFRDGASEIEIYFAYLQGVGEQENDLPYTPIIALDDKSATLHYFGRRSARNGKVFLIDAGAAENAYASDVTRTYFTDEVPTEFKQIVEGVNSLQQEVCKLVKPGASLPDLHSATHERVAELLVNTGVLTGVSAGDAVDLGLTNPFFPHGLGHMLGLLVHDVAGKQQDAQGTPYSLEPYVNNPRFQFLRSHRVLSEGNLFTVEPGVYFIPVLLDPERSGPHNAKYNWSLIDQCIPCGGVRIEDDVLVTDEGHRNITREVLP